MKLGIIGTGRIAARFVPEAAQVAGIRLTGVYNPHPGSAERFVQAHGGSQTMTPLTDLSSLFDLCDAVYIASPHETHYDYIMAALAHDKHVLCEKPMVLSAQEVEQCFRLAREKNLVLMEGLKTAYCPGYQKLLAVAADGCIGEVRLIDSCFTKLEDPGRRELTDRVYGGSFTELGSYVLLPILDLFGSGYERILFSSIRNALGLDILTRAELTYPDRLTSATCGLGVKAEGRLLISGTKGYIHVEAPWWKTARFTVHFEDPTHQMSYEAPFEGDGLRYEIAEFMRQINKTDSARMDPGAVGRSICLADLMARFLVSEVHS
ncbi:MAG: Gfo/Idh/MocA family oxidoreductase [Butyrivibrio sp.]|nr:Gfo/Idh/MocA family oxidoreductase [Butyrivibrio sp.]